MALPFLIRAYLREEPPQEKIKKHLSPAQYLSWSLAGIAACLLVNTVIRISGAARIFTGFSRISAELYGPSKALRLCATGIIIPLTEELVFRGLIFKEVRKEWTFLQAAVISSLLFGIYHGNLLQGIYGFFMGMLFARGMEKEQTIKIPVLMHIWANLTSIALTRA